MRIAAPIAFALAVPPVCTPVHAASVSTRMNRSTSVWRFLQEPQVTELQPDTTLSEPFSRIRGIRELNNGRVFVADQLEKELYIVDFAARSRTRIGHNGPGPEEYDLPTGLLAVRTDTTLMIDMGNMRLAVVASDGAITNTIPLFRDGLSIPEAADAAGNLYWDGVTGVRMKKRDDPSADQAAIMRMRSAGVLDTIGYLTIPGGVNPSPFPDWDDWAVSLDGRLAIVRNQKQYRVDWVNADGSVIRGEPIEFEPVRVNRADHDAFQKPVSQGGRGGGARVSIGSTQPAPRPPRHDFPDVFPAAMLGRIAIDYDGNVWIERHQHLDVEQPLFDVFDARARRIARVRLPARRTLVGFGPGHLYAVRTDDDGLQWLERYAIGATRLRPG